MWLRDVREHSVVVYIPNIWHPYLHQLQLSILNQKCQVKWTIYNLWKLWWKQNCECECIYCLCICSISNVMWSGKNCHKGGECKIKEINIIILMFFFIFYNLRTSVTFDTSIRGDPGKKFWKENNSNLHMIPITKNINFVPCDVFSQITSHMLTLTYHTRFKGPGPIASRFLSNLRFWYQKKAHNFSHNPWWFY